jgi:hypothetical protein
MTFFGCSRHRVSVHLLWLLLVVLTTLPTLVQAQRRVRLPKNLQEISGLARTPDGALWALNDGGNAAQLYRLDPRTGKVLESRPLPVPNRDWEDLAPDPRSGCLWIADCGNNLNRRRDLRLYRYCPATGALDSVLFRYPDQQAFPPATAAEANFDCEAVVCTPDGTLHLFTKSRFRGRHYTKHYTLPAQPGTYTATLRDSLLLPRCVVSGAALSADGRTLALVGYYFEKKWGFWPVTRASVCYLSGFGGTDFLTGKLTRRRLPRCLIARQFESVVEWEPGRWRAANEGILWQKPRLWKIRRLPD